MPELFDVAKHFDDTPVYDAYTGDYLFAAQFATFDASTADGSVNKRRILSLAPNLTPPTRRVINLFDEIWLVGDGTVDGIDGRAIRRQYWMKRVTDNFSKLTPGQACLGAAGTAAYGHKRYLKEGVNSNTDSEYDPFWEIFTAPAENVIAGTFFRSADTLYRARGTFRSIDGLQLALCDTLDYGPVSATFRAETYVPATDSTTATLSTVQVLVLDRYQFWARRTAADATDAAGDKSLLVAKSSYTPVAGHRLTLDGERWQVLTALSEQDAWLVHIRRQG